ncbi:MAG: Por secretion system C-terminal sorting protein, partial [Bacteroidetes bacterium]|nr:Por secretion system C-terminal sorting protein [Bacteroidota bacterium]
PRMMRSFNPQTFLPMDSVTIDSVSGVASSLIRWGTDGLAFRTDNNQVVILRTSLIPTHVKNHGGEIPSTVSLEQNYPNPFNPSTTIRFSLPKTVLVTLTVCNSIGQIVVLLVSETLSSGQHSVNWNASGLSSGIYFYRLRTENGVATKKLVLLR